MNAIPFNVMAIQREIIFEPNNIETFRVRNLKVTALGGKGGRWGGRENI